MDIIFTSGVTSQSFSVCGGKGCVERFKSSQKIQVQYELCHHVSVSKSCVNHGIFPLQVYQIRQLSKCYIEWYKRATY